VLVDAVNKYGQTLHSNSLSEWRLYRTTDNFDKVLAYMELHMPGFSKTHHDSYINSAYDFSLPVKISAELFSPHPFFEFNGELFTDENYIPSAIVTISHDPNDPVATLISIEYSSPSG
jgi:hypothetical protein